MSTQTKGAGVKITIIGAGAIGGTAGAFLTQAGYDVTLVDVVEEHVRAMQQRGLRITGARGDQTYAVRALTPDELAGPLQTVILAVKAHFTEAAMTQYAPLLAPDGYVVSFQNGLNEEIIARHVGAERTIGAFIHFGADYLEPGLIRLAWEQPIHLGELNGEITPRLETLQEVLGHVMPTELTTNIWGYLWGKLVYGTMAYTVSIVDAPVPEVLANPLARAVARAAAAETARIAAAQGYHLERIGGFDPTAFLPAAGWATHADTQLAIVAQEMSGEKQHMGHWRDLKVKKRKTDVDRQQEIIARGRELGIPAPMNTAIIDLVHAIERGERGMDWDNLEVLAAHMPEE